MTRQGGHAPTAAWEGVWWASGAMAGFVAGAALQLQQPALWPWFAYALTGAAATGLLAWMAHRAGRRWRALRAGAGQALILSLLAGLVAGFALAGLRAQDRAAQAIDPALEGRSLVLTGVVAGLPQAQADGLRFRFDVESALLGGQPVTVPRRLALGWYGGVSAEGAGFALDRAPPPDLLAGDRWRLVARLKAPHGALNPHGFDYELWLWEQGVGATGHVRATASDLSPQRLGWDPWRWLDRTRQAVRDAILARAGEPGADDERTRALRVVAALVTGDQGAIERSDWDRFRATGVAHLMSISGLHITMFAWLATTLLQAAWKRSARAGWRLCLWWPAPLAGALGGLLLAAAYAAFSGWGLPAQRTIVMLAVVTLLRLGGLRWPWPTVWLLAAAAVVAGDPWALLQPGFWLSFVAVGVLFAGGSRTPAPGLGGRARGLLREQMVITLALSPLGLVLFGQVSLVGVVANLAAVPWVTLVVTPLAMVGVFLAPAWELAVASLAPLSWLLDALLALPVVQAAVPAGPAWVVLPALAGGGLLVLRMPWAWRLLGLPLVVPLFLWQPVRPAPGAFELLAVDIGQGNAVLIRTRGHALLYDAGPRYSRESDAGHRVIVPLLRALDVRLDLLLISHRDSDHSGGAAAVRTQQPGARLLGSAVEAIDAPAGLAPGERCQAGQAWTWDGVRFELLHPAPADYGRGLKPNALSCVLRITAADGRAALLVGDIEAAQERQLLAPAADGRPAPGLKADLLLVPHHGSRTSSSEAFLDAVAPRIAWVQAGYRNRYGHPVAEVAERYQRRGVHWVESVRCGAATWRSDRPEQVDCQRDRARRYWHHRLP